MDLLEQASAWLDEQRKKFASRPVTYQRGELSISVPATIGKSDFDLDDGAGAIIRAESRDYLILTADLSVGLPQRGDRIVEGTLVYEVVPFGSEPCWRYSDLYRRTLRIHTKLVEGE